MALKDAAEEIKKSDEIWNSAAVQRLRDQQEFDYGLSGPRVFKMPAAEGDWESVTDNSAVLLGSKITGILSASWMNLFCDVDDETRKGRKDVAKTEQFAIGCIDMADYRNTSVPSGKTIQSLMSWYAAIEGGVVVLVYLTGENDNLIANIYVYDPMFCQWIEGDRKISWFCYRQTMTEKEFKARYPKHEGLVESSASAKTDITQAKSKNITLYHIWDEEEWKLAVNGQWLEGEGEKHAFDYVPVKIRPVGDAPVKQSDEYPDEGLAQSWFSIYTNNRNLYDIKSRLLSIGASAALESGRIKVFGEYDSRSAGAASNIEAQLLKAGYTTGEKKGRNQRILFDTAKGEKFGGIVPPPSLEAVERYLARMDKMDTIGSIDPVAWGQMNNSGSGALAAELRSAALEFITPFRKCLEDAFSWIGSECVKQAKLGHYNDVEVQGVGVNHQKFFGTIKVSEIKERRFSCNLVADRLRDQMQELGAAIQEVKAGLSSKRTAIQKHNLHPDPDAEMDKIMQEVAEFDPVLQYDKLALYFKDLGTPEGNRMANNYMALSAIMINARVQQAVSQGLISQNSVLPTGPVNQPPADNPSAQAGGMMRGQQMPEAAPPGTHQMPDGSFMADEEMS